MIDAVSLAVEHDEHGNVEMITFLVCAPMRSKELDLMHDVKNKAWNPVSFNWAGDARGRNSSGSVVLKMKNWKPR